MTSIGNKYKQIQPVRKSGFSNGAGTSLKNKVYVGLSPQSDSLRSSSAGQAGGVDGKRVFVGLSGGVDSSVSAALIKAQGYDVTGVFIKIWQPRWGVACNWKDERRDAMRVAMHLGIPFRTLDLSDEYQKDVADYMIREYRAGLTPNPDVMCNTRIKFGSFLRWALEQGADYIATGHYARLGREIQNPKSKIPASPASPAGKPAGRQNKSKIINHKSKIYLLKGVDDTKDQSYFLWQLKQAQLQHVLLPIGGYKKTEVRALAKKFGLLTADKKDSQGICFVGNIGMKEFLKKYIREQRGDVLDTQGNVIGRHDGAFFLTIGQRRGFTITRKGTQDTPYYIISKDIKKNTVTVANVSEQQTVSSKQGNKLTIDHCNWMGEVPVKDKKYQARFRHLQELKVCKVIKLKGGSHTVTFLKPQTSVAPGQSLVLYDGQKCLGGGIIKTGTQLNS